MKFLPLLVLCALVVPCAAEPVEVLWKNLGPASARVDRTNAFGVDQAGNVAYLGSDAHSPGPVRVGKIASDDGHLLWEATHGGQYTEPNRLAAVVDPKGDVIVTATYNYLTVTVMTRYDAVDGEVRWQRVNFNEPAPSEMVLDGRGGFTTLGGDFGRTESVVENHSLSDGSTRWRYKVRPGWFVRDLHAVPEGTGGVVFVSIAIPSSRPASVVRLDSEGRFLWEKPLDKHVAGRTQVPQGVAVSRSGDVAIAYKFETGVHSGQQYLTKLSAQDGSVLWSTLYKVLGIKSTTEPSAVALNARGDVLVTCSDFEVKNRRSHYSSPIVSFASRNGAAKVLFRRNAAVGGVLAIDDDQSLIVAGEYIIVPGQYDYLPPHGTFISKLNREGETLWRVPQSISFTRLFAGPGFQVFKGNNSDRSFLMKTVDGATPQTGSDFGVGATYAGLRGFVSSNGFTASGAFEFGRDPDLDDGTTTDFQPIPHDPPAYPIEASLSGLQPGTSYYYRAIATANGKTTRGIIRNFRTRPQ